MAMVGQVRRGYFWSGHVKTGWAKLGQVMTF